MKGFLSGLVGQSRIDDAKLAECEKCAQVCENYLKSLSVWTAADDHGPPPAERIAVIAVVEEIARRIRKRNHERTQAAVAEYPGSRSQSARRAR